MKPLSPVLPHAIIMMGIPGSGKSTFAEKFAETFQAPIINMHTIMRETGLSSTDAAIIADGLLKEILKTKTTFLYEGQTQTKELRAALIKDLTKKGFKTLLVWVQTDTTESRHRATRPYPKGSGLTDEAFDQAIDTFESPEVKEKAIVISGKHTFGSQLKIVLKQFIQPRPATNAAPRRDAPGSQPPRNVVLR